MFETRILYWMSPILCSLITQIFITLLSSFSSRTESIWLKSFEQTLRYLECNYYGVFHLYSLNDDIKLSLTHHVHYSQVWKNREQKIHQYLEHGKDQIVISIKDSSFHQIDWWYTHSISILCICTILFPLVSQTKTWKNTSDKICIALTIR